MVDITKVNWDSYYLKLLNSIKEKSKDPSTKVGAIIVSPDNNIISTGFNGFAIGVKDDLVMNANRYERPIKYSYTIHAEANAICLHARSGGVALKDCRIYSSLHPCPTCANLIIQSGIKEVITYSKSDDDLNRLAVDFDFQLSKEMFKEAGVQITEYVKGNS